MVNSYCDRVTEWTPSVPGSYRTLDEQLCFALYVASRAMTSQYRQGLDKLGLTYPQYLVMLVLWEHESLLVADMAQRLQLSTNTLSPLLKRLVTAGLVVKQRRTDDERQVQLTLTAAGRSLRERCDALRAEAAEAVGMPAAQVVELREQLRGLAERLWAAPSKIA